MAVTAIKTGVTDTPEGAGIQEFLGFLGGFGALTQATSPIPHGDQWQLKGSLSFTPTLITDTLPPSPVMGYKIPTDKMLLFTGGVVHGLAATLEYYRVCRRYFLFGYQATAAPSAPAAPTIALATLTDGIGTTGGVTYKLAPIDTFGRESAATAASSSVTLLSTSGVTITPPALPTGAIGYNVYRDIGATGVWKYVGSILGAAVTTDAATVAQATAYGNLAPNATWATGAIAGEVADGPCEVIIEVGAVALTGAPTTLVYTDIYNAEKIALAGTFPTTIGQRIRFKPYGETANFVPVGVVAGRANLWRGPHTSDVRTRLPFDYGVRAVSGVNAVPSAGAFIVWGQQVIGVGQRGADPVAATIHAYQIMPTHAHGILIPEYGEIVVEVGALSAGVAGVRDVTLTGLLIPIAV